MMLPETHKTKIMIKIGELQKEKVELEQEFLKERDFNASAWAEYGSELCSTEMVANETTIAKKIVDTMEKINILGHYLIGSFSALERTQLHKLIATNDEAIKELEMKRLKFQECLNGFVLLDELLMQSGVE